MTVSLIEIRIWTVYPGQFPGQPDARDSATFRLNDPDGQLSKKINRLEHLERCKDELSTQKGPLSDVKRKNVLRNARRVRKELVRLLKKNTEGTVAKLETADRSFHEVEPFQKTELLEKIDGADSIELYVTEVESFLATGPRKTLSRATIKSDS